MRPLATVDLDSVVEHAREALAQARGGRFFITGGTGFFGRWLLESFLHANRRLGLEATATVLTRDATRFRAAMPHVAEASELRFLEGDSREFVFPDGGFDFGIHAATETRPAYAAIDPVDLIAANIAGAARFLKFAGHSGMRRLLFTSSGAVYGTQPSGVTHVQESSSSAPDPLKPGSAYGEAKRCCELMFAAANATGRCETVIARCFAFVGPHLPLDANYAIGNFLRDALDGRPLAIGGDGTPRRSYLYAADLAAWLWVLLLRGRGGEAYNVGSARDHSILEIAQAVGRVVSPGSPVTIARTPDPAVPVNRYVPDNLKAVRGLGLAEWTSLEEGIRRTASWHRNKRP